MEQPGYVHEVLIILAAAVVIVPLFRRIGVSAVLGYLCVGVVIGPGALDLIQRSEEVEVLASFGVVFLLFFVGLELSLGRLRELRREVFGLGTAQVVATGLAIGGAVHALGVGSGPALVLGGALALSSTAMVLQMLVERHELAAPHGRLALSVLLLQDLAVVPLLTLVPLLGGARSSVPVVLGSALLRSLVVLLLVVGAGRVLLRPALRMVARGRNPELFTAIVLLLVLGAGWVTHRAGLSMALGAFLAGLLIAETEYRAQVEGEMEPFRGILLALFFVTVGMGIDLRLLRERPELVLGLAAALVALKATVLAALCRLFGFPAGTSARVGLTLAQSGEFGFVLFALGSQTGVLPAEPVQIAVLVLGVSMAATPLLVAAGRVADRRLAGRAAVVAARRVDDPGPRDHVVIAGYGRVGQTLARILEREGVPYVALDLDAELVTEARRRHQPVHYGDAARPDVLRALGAARARAAVVTLDRSPAAERAVRALHRLRPDLPVIARARDLAECARLEAAGATSGVPEMVEGSLRIGATLLGALGEPPVEVSRILDDFRRQSYAPLGDLIRPRAETPADAPAPTGG